MSSDVQICSAALVRLGAKSISSFDELSTGPLCAEVFPDVKLRVLTAGPWRSIITKSDELTRTLISPSTQYKYEYQLPPNMLSGLPLTVWNSAYNSGRGTPFIDFNIFGTKLLTNAEQIFVDYKVDIDPELLPPHINQLMIYAVMAEIAVAVTDQQTKADAAQKTAWGTPEQNGKGGYFKEAQRIDSQGHPSQSIKSFPLVNVRHGGL